MLLLEKKGLNRKMSVVAMASNVSNNLLDVVSRRSSLGHPSGADEGPVMLIAAAFCNIIRYNYTIAVF